MGGGRRKQTQHNFIYLFFSIITLRRNQFHFNLFKMTRISANLSSVIEPGCHLFFGKYQLRLGMKCIHVQPWVKGKGGSRWICTAVYPSRRNHFPMKSCYIHHIRRRCGGGCKQFSSFNECEPKTWDLPQRPALAELSRNKHLTTQTNSGVQIITQCALNSETKAQVMESMTKSSRGSH